MTNIARKVWLIPALASFVMARAGNVYPRKMPLQDRSRITVRRILDAAGTVLEERGYGGMSTTRIAAAAGISPGSVYQYFPNKNAILKTLVGEYSNQLLESVSAKLRAVGTYKPTISISAAIEAQVDEMLERPEVLRVACEYSPQLGCVDVLAPLENTMFNTIQTCATSLPGPPADVDVEAATWLIVQLLRATARYVVDKPPISKDSFVNELTRTVVGHPIMEALARQRH